jgi:hypothetical protein
MRERKYDRDEWITKAVLVIALLFFFVSFGNNLNPKNQFSDISYISISSISNSGDNAVITPSIIIPDNYKNFISLKANSQFNVVDNIVISLFATNNNSYFVFKRKEYQNIKNKILDINFPQSCSSLPEVDSFII